MAKNKRTEKQPVTKLTPDEIFDALRNPEVENIYLADGAIDGEKLTFICSDRKNGDVVPLAILLDKKAVKVLKNMEDDLARIEEDEPEDGDGEDGEDGDEDEAFAP